MQRDLLAIDDRIVDKEMRGVADLELRVGVRISDPEIDVCAARELDAVATSDTARQLRVGIQLSVETLVRLNARDIHWLDQNGLNTTARQDGSGNVGRVGVLAAGGRGVGSGPAQELRLGHRIEIGG